jgi:hypothetical protein
MSNIDPSKPTAGQATTQSVRDNFQAAADEIDANAAAAAAAQAAADAAQAKADMSVQLTGAQTIADLKTFTTNPQSNAAQAGAAQALTRKDYVDQAIADAIAAIPPPAIDFPVGAMLIGFDPNGIFPGTWEQLPEGTFLMNTIAGADPAGGSNNAVTISHTHTASSPPHSHTIQGDIDNGSNSRARTATTNRPATISTDAVAVTVTVDPAGVDGTGLNRPQYVGVAVWQRTA